MIVVGVILWVLLIFFWAKKFLKHLAYKVEKLEELDGEFIYTSLKVLRKKSEYFHINEVEMAYISKMVMTQNFFKSLSMSILLKDSYTIKLQKKKDCILFLKSCKENEPELFNKMLGAVPIGIKMIGIDIPEMIEKEIEDYKNNK